MPNDDFVSRLITAGEAVGPTRPQLAHTLASSDLSHGEIQAVGGFAQAMALATANRLAADSGARVNFNATERNQLDGIKEPIAGAEAEGEVQDSRSWLEQAVDKVAGYASNTFSLLLHNPVSDLAFDAFRELGNAAHMPFRLLSDAVDGSNSDEIDTSMQRQGYDPDSTTSYLAFMWNKGESQYHDLSAARDVYGDEMIDAILQAQADPEQFQSDYEHMAPEEAAKLGQIMESPDWAQAYDAINRQHISPGRDVARILTLGHTDNAAFTFLSGTLDAAYTWFTDPTLVLGKGVQAARAMDATTGALAAGSRFAPSNLAARGIDKLRGGNQRAGLTSMADQAGIEKLLRVENGQAVTQVGKGWESFLGQASELRKQNKIARDTKLSTQVRAEAEAKRAGIFRGMQSQYGPLMPLLDAINGKRVVSEATSTGGRIDGLASGHVVETGDPIETLGDLAKYLVSTDGLLSLHNGMAARRQIIMPGRLSWAAEKRAARAGKRAERWIDYTKGNALLPDEAEIPLAEAMAKTAGRAQHDLLTKSMFTSARAARAKAERVSRRFSTILPRVNHIDLTDSSSSKVVEQVARMYLNRGDAARLASAYALGDMAARRNILRGVLVQSFHASGLAKSPAGKAFMERYIGDQADLARQQYGMGDTSKILTDRGEVQAALYPDQLSTKVLIPSFREMNYLATKFAVAGFAGKTGLAHVRAIAQAPGMDRLMGTIKLGWITTAAGGLRNALDEVANFAATGLGRETLAARSTFTQATKDLRDKRREYSREYLAMASRNGRDLADEMVARRVGEGLKSHADAKLALERAQSKGEDPLSYEADLKAAEREMKHARGLESAVRHRLPYFARTIADNVNDVLTGVVLGKLVSFMGSQYKITDQDVKYAQELLDAELTRTLHEGVFQSHYADSVLLETGDEGAMALHRAGLRARKYAYGSKSLGWGQVEADGGAGNDAWAKMLQLRFADEWSPANAWVQTLRAMHRVPSSPFGTLDEFKASGEELLHGTSAKFDTFDGSRDHGNTGRGIGDRVYMTNQPGVADNFAWNGNSWTAQELHENHFRRVAHGQYDDQGVTAATKERLRAAQEKYDDVRNNSSLVGDEQRAALTAAAPELRAAEAQAMREFVDHQLDSGWRVRVDPLDGGEYRVISSKGELSKLPEQEVWVEPSAWSFIPPDRDPRTIKAKVYGKTIDLRTKKHPRNPDGTINRQAGMVRGKDGIHRTWEPIEPEIPADLDAALKAEQRWHPKNDGGSNTYGHERSKALTDWMRANGYGKALVDDAGESGMESYVVLPEMIAHGANDPLAAHAASLAPMSAQEWNDALQAAKQSARRILDDDELRHFVANAEVFKQTKAGVRVGDDAELQSLAKDEYADRVSADLLLTLGRQDPNGGIYINRGLLDELADGRVPDRSWLSQLPKDERPEHTIGQLWAPYNPNHAPGTMPAGYSQMLTKAYDKVVTDQINALSRNPLMTALYINARKNTLGYEKKLRDAGWDEQSAAEVTKRIAAAHAQDEAFKHIDNPYVASQFSTIGRNYFAFVRAQEDWLRRWGRTIRDNPQVIRQAQLLIHGGTSTGMVEKDDQDNLVFVYPASGLILGILNKVLPGAAQIPMNGELTSQLQFLNPSLDNPLGFSGTPLVSLPFKIMTAILGPDHALLTASMDKVINGELGAGREWYEQLMPSWVNRIIGGVISEDPASKYGAAYTQALANMEAAGQLDDPELQTASGKARFQDALSVGIKNNLAAMALFGFFAPAAPALNAEASAVAEGQQGNRPDFSAHEIGLRTLKDEARRVFAELPYEEALAWWQAVHPRELIYALTGDSSRTQAGTKNASAPATIAAARWMEQNGDFTAAFGGKGGIAAYFIPQGAAGTVNGSYSDVAYRAQLETGMREYKSLDDYFDDIVTARGAAIYFAAKDEYDQARSAAQGSPSRQAALDAQWQATKDEIYQGNPLLAEKQAEYATANASTQGQLAQVYKMVQSNSPVVSRALGANRDGVLQMLMAYESFKATTGQLGDRRGNVANRRRQQAKDAYESTIKALSTQYPDLADLGRGVFRLP